jgi:hypothetical protein
VRRIRATHRPYGSSLFASAADSLPLHFRRAFARHGECQTLAVAQRATALLGEAFYQAVDALRLREMVEGQRAHDHCPVAEQLPRKGLLELHRLNCP